MSEITGGELERKRGDTRPDIINVTGDITGFSYLLTLNTHRNPNADIDLGPLVGMQLMQSVGVVVPGVGIGQVIFPWTDANADLPGNKTYWYDVQQTDTAGKIGTIFKNKYRFYWDVTKT